MQLNIATWVCNCKAGVGTNTPCSHTLMFWKAIYLHQNNIKIKTVKLHKQILDVSY